LVLIWNVQCPNSIELSWYSDRATGLATEASLLHTVQTGSTATNLRFNRCHEHNR